MQDVLFESKDMVGKNLFNDYLTDFSKFLIRKSSNGLNFFDYKVPEKRNINLKFTIDVRTTKNESTNLRNEDLEEKLFEHLNSVKTLTCNFSVIILQGVSDDKAQCVILMMACVSKIRENFDDIVLIS
jgi:hypothetical protein